MTAGLLTLAVGFLTVHPISATAGPLEDAVKLLDRLEAERARVLAHADSLGRMLSSLPTGEGKQAKAVLRDAEDLGKRARDLDIEILLSKEQCRGLVQQELDAIQTQPRSDLTASEKNALADRESVLNDLLERRLNDRWAASRVLVQPDSTDGYETLLDKLAYLQDLQDEITALDKSLTRRIDQIRRERSLREASREFGREEEFIDEGGRLGSEGTVILRGLGGSEEPSGAAGRRIGTRDGAVTDEEIGAPAPGELGGPSNGDRLGSLLRARERLSRELKLVASALQDTETLLVRYPPAGR